MSQNDTESKKRESKGNEKDEEYKVGKNKPPIHTRFKKGDIPNPNGRPKGSRNYATVIKELLELNVEIESVGDSELREKISKLENILGKKLSNREVIVLAQMKKAQKGDTYAFNALADREEGKAAQRNINENVELTYEEFLETIKEVQG